MRRGIRAIRTPKQGGRSLVGDSASVRETPSGAEKSGAQEYLEREIRLRAEIIKGLGDCDSERAYSVYGN